MSLRAHAAALALIAVAGALLWLGIYILAGEVLAGIFLHIYIAMCVLGLAFYALICGLTIYAHSDKLKEFFRDR